jgi:cystathionine beta-lyase
MTATLADPAANPLEQLSIEQLRARTSEKWRTYPADVLPLWVAEMDVPLALPVADAVRAALDAGDTGYPTGRAYADAVRGFAARRWGWTFESAQTRVVADVMTGVVETLKLVTEPGDPVVVCAPVYPPFYAFSTMIGRRVLEAPLAQDGRLDLDALDVTLAAARRRSPRPVLLLSNPHNPTGIAHTRTELVAVAATAARHGARVISDEIHAPLVYADARFTPYLSVDGRGFALMSGSKGWNLAGLKAALLIAGADAGADLARFPQALSHGPCHLGVIAHAAAFREGGPWLDALLRGLTANRQLIAALLAEHLPAVGYRPPQSTYLAWLDCRAVAADPAALFLERAHVAVNPGADFGHGGAGFVRLNFATSPSILREAIRRMGRAGRSRAA